MGEKGYCNKIVLEQLLYLSAIILDLFQLS